MESEKLINKLKQLLASVQGIVSIYFEDVNTHFRFKQNEFEQYNTASLMKVFIGLEMLMRIEKRDFDLNFQLEIKNSFHSKYDNSNFELLIANDSEKELYNKIGNKVGIMELMELMITKSSNLATNNLFSMLERGNSIQHLLSSLKMSDTQIIRCVEDQKAFDAGIINYTNAADIYKLFKFINDGVFSGNTYITTLYEILKRQEHNSIIPHLLPKDLCIAHKTGSIKCVLHDAGIISSDNGLNYILVILSKNLVDKEKAISSFAKISQIIYQFVIKNKIN